MLSATAQLDAHAEYGRSDGQGLFVTVWGTGCYVSHVYDYFDGRGTDGREPGWRLFFTLAPQEMGRTAGAKGAFVAPQSRDYAYKGLAAGMSPLKSSTPAEAWLDDLERVVGLEVRGQVKAWVAGGLSEQRLKKAVRGAVDPRLVYERLRDADKGIYQQRVVINDYQHTPGVEDGKYLDNSLPKKEILAGDFGIDDVRFNLPPEKAITFTGDVRLNELKPGEKIYRVANDPVLDPRGKTGGYWTRNPPEQLSDVIGGTAVMPEWNNFQVIYEFTVPPYEDPINEKPKFYVWEGLAAAQPVSLDYEEKKDISYHLPGGKPQIFINNYLAWDKKFPNNIKDCTKSKKKW